MRAALSILFFFIGTSVAIANPAPDNIVEYKKVGNDSLTLHIFTPPNHKATDKRPAIVFFFGGGWIGGSPGQFYPQSEYLASRGMVAICADYRTQKKTRHHSFSMRQRWEVSNPMDSHSRQRIGH